MMVMGPAVDDPEAAVAIVEEVFSKRGFEVLNKFDSKFKDDRYIVFAMGNENGAELIYKPGTANTQLVVTSGCTTDPAMDIVTK